MSQAIAYSKSGAKKETAVKLSKSVFDVEANHDLIAVAYQAYQAAGRTAGAMTLTRGLVAGGGKKPHRQKGTGRARMGSIRVPQARHGGIVFGPTGNENHLKNLNLKAKRAAIRQALSLKAAAGAIRVLDAFDAGDGKVKTAASLLSKLGLQGSVVLVVADRTDSVDRSTRNIAGLTTVAANYLNVYTVMNADNLVFTADALEKVEQWLGETKPAAKPAAKAEETAK
jgi:large subunit ribosomal protein L4